MKVTQDTPLTSLTVGQLKTYLKGEESTSTPNEQPRRFVYGLRGIRQLFGVSHVTAQRYKDSFLAPAVSQRGRIIVVDADKAIRLFNEYLAK